MFRKTDFALKGFLSSKGTSRSIILKMLILSGRIERAIDQACRRRLNLSLTEARILAAIGECGSMSANDACALTDINKTRMSRSVHRLERAGLLTLHVDPEDRRRIQLVLTTTGEVQSERSVLLALVIEEKMLAMLPPDDRAPFNRALALFDRRAAHFETRGLERTLRIRAEAQML